MWWKVHFSTSFHAKSVSYAQLHAAMLKSKFHATFPDCRILEGLASSSSACKLLNKFSLFLKPSIGFSIVISGIVYVCSGSRVLWLRVTHDLQVVSVLLMRLLQHRLFCRHWHPPNFSQCETYHMYWQWRISLVSNDCPLAPLPRSGHQLLQTTLHSIVWAVEDSQKRDMTKLRLCSTGCSLFPPLVRLHTCILFLQWAPRTISIFTWDWISWWTSRQFSSATVHLPRASQIIVTIASAYPTQKLQKQKP